jgi:hypothetical protein
MGPRSDRVNHGPDNHATDQFKYDHWYQYCHDYQIIKQKQKYLRGKNIITNSGYVCVHILQIN